MAPKRFRVLLLAAANATSGGGERHVADLLTLLPNHGIDVWLACPPGGDLTALATKLGIPCAPVEIGSGLTPSKVASVARAINEAAPDIVHAHGSRAALFARLADAQAARRCVYTVHGIHADKAGSAARRAIFLAIERWLRPRTAHFVTVCESDIAKGERLGILDAKRSTTVYNGIETPAETPERGAFRAELGLADEVPLALSIGRFHEQKDQATLLRAWRRVVDQMPSAVLALLGGGELEGRLREVAMAQGLGESVRFVSPRAGLDTAYADADVFALSSLWEGLPYVVLEAMAYRLPVASTNVDGIPEAVVDGECGLLVEPAAPEALADAIVALLRDPELRASMGEAGRARVAERFALEDMAAGLVGVYERASGKSVDWPPAPSCKACGGLH